MNSFNSELQLKDNKSAIRHKLNALLTELKVFKFVKILFLKFRKIENDYETKHLLLKAEHIIETDIDNIFGSICRPNTLLRLILIIYLDQSVV